MQKQYGTTSIADFRDLQQDYKRNENGAMPFFSYAYLARWDTAWKYLRNNFVKPIDKRFLLWYN